VAGAASGTGAGSTYYAVSSQDGDGDESAQSLGISPAAMVSSAAGSAAAAARFIDTVSQSLSKQGLWLVVLLTVGLALCKRVQGSKVQGSRLR
jgi:hypothetical protein